ncbi:BON domain-containing protein [Ensifer sp. HO-A22]|uniref:BON domain-containing protein n=1 Tax=Ensifer oleiphilus TaxID=2742698 RepID=A0A7Y6Q6J0_9HYPH|nr:BON domain-containing protein [Ensifer oleiphilus]NVD39921.1 BON domain-containing protein [Ensifer oleiphilus]
MNDLILRQDILDELEYEPSVHAAGIGVAVDQGIVTLSGHVASFVEKYAVERIVRDMRGVRAIAQELEVRLPEHKKTADDEIASRVLAVLEWAAAVSRPDDIDVTVRHGFVTLEGTVDWHFQRTAAENAVRQLAGVTGISNQLEIRPNVNRFAMAREIEDALKRNTEIDAEDVHIKTSGGQVTLSGSVRTLRERALVERAAWSATGVTVVEDQLLVDDQSGDRRPL